MPRFAALSLSDHNPPTLQRADRGRANRRLCSIDEIFLAEAVADPRSEICC